MSALGWIAVGLLGGIAAAARFAIDTAVKHRMDLRAAPPGEGSTDRLSHFPLWIFVVNISGSLALGLVAGAALHGEALVIVAGGGIGSFTTFSTWILDSHRLAEAGDTHLAWLNIGLSLAAGFAAVTLGHWLGGAL
jgi:fluoride exporter